MLSSFIGNSEEILSKHLGAFSQNESHNYDEISRSFIFFFNSLQALEWSQKCGLHYVLVSVIYLIQSQEKGG